MGKVITVIFSMFGFEIVREYDECREYNGNDLSLLVDRQQELLKNLDSPYNLGFKSYTDVLSAVELIDYKISNFNEENAS